MRKIFKNWFYFDLRNPFKTYKKASKIFKPLKWCFRFGWNKWSPITLYKRASIQIVSSDVGWKDKYETPRYEYSPFIWISIFSLNFVWYQKLPSKIKEKVGKDFYEDDYWEQLLWFVYYDNNISVQATEGKSAIEKARLGWPWQDMKGKSTWKNEFLKDYYALH